MITKTNTACSLLLALTLATTARAADPPPTVPSVDLERYVGTWYEIAKIPNRFQDHCISNTTATYATRADGRLDVINRCVTEGGGEDVAKGIARVVDPATHAKLKVSFLNLFGWQLFWGDYWVLDLPEDYRTVIVGHPKRSYGWILSRTPTLSAERRAQLDQRLGELGYDPGVFANSLQAAEP